MDDSNHQQVSATNESLAFLTSSLCSNSRCNNCCSFSLSTHQSGHMQLVLRKRAIAHCTKYQVVLRKYKKQSDKCSSKGLQRQKKKKIIKKNVCARRQWTSRRQSLEAALSPNRGESCTFPAVKHWRRKTVRRRRRRSGHVLDIQ